MSEWQTGVFDDNSMDDILIISMDEEEHLKHLQVLFKRLMAFGLIVNSDKCLL